jgi:DNA primase
MDRKAAISEIANQILSQTDIVQVIGERIPLTNRGKSHVACCPFHHENTPSFHVMHKDQYYYCFGCKASGNAIHFLREYDRMSFFETLDYLARQAGIEMPALNQQKPDHSQADFDCLQEANQRFQDNLRESQSAIEYLKNRGITGITAKKFELGFAKELWDDILTHLSSGSSDSLERLHTHGLIITNEKGRRYDRFRNRITFPIRDSRGRTIGFGARTLGDDTPKYLNSPQTPLFHKSEVLYGIYELLESCRNPPFILVTEGYLDVISLHQAGIPQAVATLGTASNRGQLRQLQRYTDRIIVCFDGDTAGRKAAWHALTEALPIANEKLDLRFLFLPEDEDPDSYLRKYGPDHFRALIEQAKPLSEAFFDHLFSEHSLSSLDGKARCAKAALESIETMPTGLLRTLLTEELAKRLGIDTKALIENPNKTTTNDLITATSVQRPAKKPVAPISRALVLLLKNTQLLEQTNELAELAELAHQLLSPPRELKLLIAVYEQLKLNPRLSTGQLINLFENESLQHYLLEITANDDAIAPELQADELLDAVSLSIKWCVESQIEALIELSRTRALHTDEKKRLHGLLLSNARSGIRSSQD